MANRHKLAPSSYGWLTLEQSSLGLQGFSHGGECKLGVLAVKIRFPQADTGLVADFPLEPATSGILEGASLLKTLEGLPLFTSKAVLAGIGMISSEGAQAVQGGVQG